MRRVVSPLPMLLLAVLVGACDQPGASASPEEPRAWGYEDASSADMAAIPRALAASDVDGVVARAQTLWRMSRAMQLGDRVFASFVGLAQTRFQALATIDPGGASGEVAFYQWDKLDLEDGRADPEEALRWIVVSVTLDPDEALEPQELQVTPTPEQTRTLAALSLAQQQAKTDHPEGRWVAHCIRELEIIDGAPTGARQTRVYLFGQDERSPDLEFAVVDPVRRKQPPVITAKVLHLPAGASAKLPLTTPAQSPGPSTLARAVAIATATGKPVPVVDGAGQRWSVAPGTGALSRE